MTIVLEYVISKALSLSTILDSNATWSCWFTYCHENRWRILKDKQKEVQRENNPDQ